MEDKVLVITLNYNQNEFTINCVNSLLESSYTNFIVLIVDNGSDIGNYFRLERELGNKPGVLLKRIENNCGYVGGVNFGLREGIKLRPDYFIVMNNDTIVDKDLIRELVSAEVKCCNKAIVAGKVFHMDEPNKLQMVGFKIINRRLLITEKVGADEIDHGQYDKVMEYDSLDDICWLFPARLYSEIGCYSNYFWFNYEQEDFLLRAKKAGYRPIYTPKAKIWHKGSLTIGGSNYNPKQAYWTIQSALIMKYLHLRKFYFVQFYILTVISIIRTFIKSLYLKIFYNMNIYNYAKAKYKGLLYFNKWLVKKNINTGINPFSRT